MVSNAFERNIARLILKGRMGRVVREIARENHRARDQNQWYTLAKSKEDREDWARKVLAAPHAGDQQPY